MTWTNVDLSSMEFCGIHLTTILQAAHEISVHGMSLKIKILKLWPHLAGANELKSQQTPLSAPLHVSYGDNIKKETDPVIQGHTVFCCQQGYSRLNGIARYLTSTYLEKLNTYSLLHWSQYIFILSQINVYFPLKPHWGIIKLPSQVILD